MKTKYIIITLMLIIGSISMSAQNSTEIFDRFSNNEDITTVFISKALLQLAPELKADMGGANISNLIGKLTQIEIYTTEKKGVAQMMKKESEKFIKNKTYESLMKIKDKGNNVDFLIQRNRDRVDELLMVVSDEKGCTIIRIAGDFTMEDIQKVINDSKGK